ncbi:MAG: SEC-C metal-binding domain-containing protein [Pyrinomonadaceae bacterium]
MRGRPGHLPRGRREAARTKTWFERAEGATRLAYDQQLVAREYPSLSFRIDRESGDVYLEGNLVYRSESGIPTEVPVQVNFPFDYPNREPRAFDVAGLFEHSLDRHFANDEGACCLWLPPKSRWNPSDPDTLLTFLDEVVLFFHRQLIYDATGRKNWPGPQYGHRIDGYEQWIAEVFGKEDALRAFVPILNANLKVGRNDRCPCQSGRKFKRCHAEILEDIRRNVATTILSRLFTDKGVRPSEEGEDHSSQLAMSVGGSGTG